MDFKKIVADGDICRKNYIDGINAFINRKNNECYDKREEFMPPERLTKELESYRHLYLEMLGVTKIDSTNCHEPQMIHVGDDDECSCYRVITYITPEIPFYSLLFKPHNLDASSPFIIAQHGGLGTPEICSEMLGKNNYNGMVRRVIERNAVVLAPQLLLWNTNKDYDFPLHNIPFDRVDVDNNLKRFGLSITALEVKGIMNAITYMCEQDFVNKDKIGMVGLSYGGYYTMHTMAADTRIKAGYSNAVFNDRNIYTKHDWSYKDSANTFQDAEVAALCAPRSLYVAVGTEDHLFKPEYAIAESERVKKYFEAFDCPENYVFEVWEGTHSVPDSDTGFDFLFNALNN